MSVVADMYSRARWSTSAEREQAQATQAMVQRELATRTEQVREVLADAIEDYRDEAPRSGETDDALGEIARRIRALRVREIEETIGGGEP